MMETIFAIGGIGTGIVMGVLGFTGKINEDNQHKWSPIFMVLMAIFGFGFFVSKLLE